MLFKTEFCPPVHIVLAEMILWCTMNELNDQSDTV